MNTRHLNHLVKLLCIAGGLWACLLNAGAADAQPAGPPRAEEIDNYQPGPDSKPQAGVPKGETFSFQLEDSKFFPGTHREITVYVPAEYKGDKPACVYVGLDGLGFEAPVVFDNLIHRGEMPVTIAIGVSSGAVASSHGEENPRFNRSFEFDGLNDSLARCVTEEIFPAVEQHPTAGGVPIHLSRDPNDHCAGGASTGGIGAFTLAWERPDLFRRVFTAIGTFVDMRGGDRYPALVRETEPKPIRIFQQDGSHDEWMGGPEVGDWWLGNQALDRALEFSGYDHQHVWGTGPHSGAHAAAIFPEAIRYLWKDWPKPVSAKTAATQNVILQAVLDPDSPWQLVSGTEGAVCHLAVNPRGEVFYLDRTAKRARKLGGAGPGSDATAIAGDKVFAFSADGRALTAGDINATSLSVTASGNIYATEADAGKVWLIKSDGRKILLDAGLKGPAGLALSPDHLWLAVMENRAHAGYSYRVKPDGTVDSKQPFYWAHVPDWADDSGAGDACMDREGHLYVATRLGVQIFDRNGRSRGILPLPAGEATSLCFGGANFDTLFVASGGRLYQRHMKAIGAPPFAAPIKLPNWSAG
ncbi:MAG: SMP-30/gluconolactonase/LRE family protein [Verrucomicrobiota bacterium]